MTEKSSALLSRFKDRLALPVIAAPMFLVSSPELVRAVRREGVMGSFPFPLARTTEMLDDWLSQTLTGDQDSLAPFAANMVTHTSYDRLGAEIALLEKYRPEIVITALGGPKPVMPAVHGYGGLVFADVNSLDYARKATDAGVDGLVLVSAGAGGHTGEMTGFAFVSAVREFFDGVIVLGGGINTGRAVRAAEVLGADLAYVGTHFLGAEETMAHPDYRKFVVAAEFRDLILSSAITGANAYYLKASLERAGIDLSAVAGRGKPDFANSQKDIKAWRDLWSAGHGVGAVRAIRAARDIIADLAREYDEAASRAPSSFLRNKRWNSS
ncbi:MAG: nitronate monooxygenase [Pseudomonadota bacterium]|nr:nitronate monooxygenase [Pseudomonadota bacterium]